MNDRRSFIQKLAVLPKLISDIELQPKPKEIPQIASGEIHLSDYHPLLSGEVFLRDTEGRFHFTFDRSDYES